MWLVTAAMFIACKLMTLHRVARPQPTTRLAGYLLAWPGLDASAFLDRSRRVTRDHVAHWIAATSTVATGASLIWIASRHALSIHPQLAAWTGMTGLVLLMHFGTFRLVSLGWRAVGVDARPLMDAPLLARSLGEFWSRRWNTAFRDLAYHHVYVPVQRRVGATAATIAVFVFSGAIHDAAISIPAGGGYGLPTSYFLLQAVATRFERSRWGRRLGLRRGWRGRAFTFAIVALPAPMLFHRPFTIQVILPFLDVIGAL